MPNLKFLASTVREILGGVLKFQNWVTWPHMTPFDKILIFFSLRLTAVSLRAKFEVSSFNRSRDIRGVPIFQMLVTWPPHDPFWHSFVDFGYFFPFSIRLSNLTRIASSMTDMQASVNNLDIKKFGNVSPDVCVTVTLCEDWNRPTSRLLATLHHNR